MGGRGQEIRLKVCGDWLFTILLASPGWRCRDDRQPGRIAEGGTDVHAIILEADFSAL